MGNHTAWRMSTSWWTPNPPWHRCRPCPTRLPEAGLVTAYRAPVPISWSHPEPRGQKARLRDVRKKLGWNCPNGRFIAGKIIHKSGIVHKSYIVQLYIIYNWWIFQQAMFHHLKALGCSVSACFPDGVSIAGVLPCDTKACPTKK